MTTPSPQRPTRREVSSGLLLAPVLIDAGLVLLLDGGAVGEGGSTSASTTTSATRLWAAGAGDSAAAPAEGIAAASPLTCDYGRSDAHLRSPREWRDGNARAPAAPPQTAPVPASAAHPPGARPRPAAASRSA